MPQQQRSPSHFADSDWAETGAGLQASAYGDLPAAGRGANTSRLFEPRPGLFARAIGLVGEVFSGKPKPRGPSGRTTSRGTFNDAPQATTASRHPRAAASAPQRPPMSDIPSTLGPYLPPPPRPVLTAEQRAEIEREMRVRTVLVSALASLFSQEDGRRRRLKELWSIEQNLRVHGARGLADVSDRVIRAALEQLETVADYSAANHGEALWHLRDLLLERHSDEDRRALIESGASRAPEPAQEPAVARPAAPVQQAAAQAAAMTPKLRPAPPHHQIPVIHDVVVPVSERAVHHGLVEQPIVLEGHGLSPFVEREPIVFEDLGELEVPDLPALTMRERGG